MDGEILAKITRKAAYFSEADSEFIICNSDYYKNRCSIARDNGQYLLIFKNMNPVAKNKVKAVL